MSEKTLCSQSDSNSLNLIRLIAAMQVFLLHSMNHLSVPRSYWFRILDTFQGVPLFFALSGFFIWKSIERSNSFSFFCKKRVYRLFPELWAGVILNFAVIIILYGSQIEWVPYIAFQFTQGTFLQFWTPDTLRGYGCGTPNGSLWTVGVMLQSYIVMWIVYKLLKGKKPLVWIIVNLTAILLSFTPMLAEILLPEILSKLYGQTFIPYIWLFLLGATLSEFYEQIAEWLKRFWYVFFALALVISLTGFDITGSYGVFKAITVTPAVIGFAYRYPKFNVPIDLSYGIYIFHMIVINVMIHFGLKGNPLYILLAFTITFILAVISYMTVGKVGRNKRNILKGKEAYSDADKA